MLEKCGRLLQESTPGRSRTNRLWHRQLNTACKSDLAHDQPHAHYREALSDMTLTSLYTSTKETLTVVCLSTRMSACSKIWCNALGVMPRRLYCCDSPDMVYVFPAPVCQEQHAAISRRLLYKGKMTQKTIRSQDGNKHRERWM